MDQVAGKKLSKRASCIEPSLTRDLFNRALRLDGVINLTLGDPDLPPPQPVRDAACRAIQAGQTHYSANAGLLELREKLSEAFSAEYHLPCSAENVMVTVGGMEALYLTLSALIDPGDEVIIFAPYYVNYVQMVRMNGGVPVILPTREEAGFTIDLTALRAKLSERTVALILNTPCNPTGAVISAEVLAEIATMARERDLIVIADEVYKALLYDGATHHSILAYPGMQERTVLVDSLSKKYSMTGWRLGWTVGPEPLISAMTKMQENVAACAALPSQYGALEALKATTDVEYIRDTFTRRRDLMVRALNACPKLSVRKPEATFYLFVNISGTGLSSRDFALRLLEEGRVAVVPGVAYGTPYDGFVRIAFTQEESVLAEACRRIAHFVESL